MKASIPQEIKDELPPTRYSKVLGMTPVVMTVIATVLAGLSSSEMTSAQYDRSLAAQLQSKAGDQWALFQAKRLRGALQRSTLDTLSATTDLRPIDSTALRQSIDQLPLSGNPEAAQWHTEANALLSSQEAQSTLAALEKTTLPAVPAAAPVDPKVTAALEAVEHLRPESEVNLLLSQVSQPTLVKAQHAAEEHAQAFDAAVSPLGKATDQMESLLFRGKKAVQGGASPSEINSLSRDFVATRLRFAATRYDAEARLNQAIASILELQVRKNNVSAERHHLRSQRFFFGMLAAQMAVVIASLAIAARQRSLLWSIAAVAGLGAITFAAYVYFGV